MVHGVIMADLDAITQNIANFLPAESITMADAVRFMGVSKFEMLGEPTTQEEWDVSFTNHDTETTVTFEQVYAKYLELKG